MSEANGYGAFDLLGVEVIDGVATTAISAPPMNVMTLELFGQLAKFGAEVAADDDVRVVVLRGAGRAFCAGQDLTEMLALLDGTSDIHEFPRMLAALTGFSKPLIAAVDQLLVKRVPSHAAPGRRVASQRRPDPVSFQSTWCRPRAASRAVGPGTRLEPASLSGDG